MKKIFKYKNYNSILMFLKRFNIKSFESKKKTDLYVNFFELNLLLKRIPEDFKKNKIENYSKAVIKPYKKSYKFELSDLCRLHWVVLTRKVLNVLEFGSGYSTLFMADAHFILSFFFKKLDFSRNEKNFHTYAVEESKYFAKDTLKKIPSHLIKYITISTSKIKTIYYKHHFASKYESLPNISPDFIYLDAPTLYFTEKKFEGFTFAKKNRVPMSSDLLLIEYFLEPRTAIIVDGRTANARFLRDNFKRKWKYIEDLKEDYHYFELVEKPLGKINKNKIKFCLGSKYKFSEK